MRHFHWLTGIKLLAGIALLTLGMGSSFAGKPVDANSMGLSKGSVFDVPTPKVYHYGEAQPGQSKVLPRAYPGAPPQIPHDIGDFLPITAQNNMCISCHAQPEQWGKKPVKGTPTPIPPSHYTDLRNPSGKVTDHLMGARFNCNQCHVPQTDAAPLVENTFSSRRAR
jgi:cytochrome c-type protein NapB